jgi:predicted site-specific integrase-resolvase
MMNEYAEVEVVYSHDLPEREKKANDRETVDGATAKRLIKAGYVRVATKPAAKVIGVDPETAASVKKV